MVRELAETLHVTPSVLYAVALAGLQIAALVVGFVVELPPRHQALGRCASRRASGSRRPSAWQELPSSLQNFKPEFARAGAGIDNVKAGQARQSIRSDVDASCQLAGAQNSGFQDLDTGIQEAERGCSMEILSADP